MRVGIDIGPLTRNRTGVGNYCYYLLKHLLPLDPAAEWLGFSASRSPIALDGLDGKLAHRHIPVPTRLMYKCWNWTGRPRVDRLLGGVDVYHATNYFLPPTASARRAVTIHDLAFMVAPELCSPRIVGPFAGGMGGFARGADAILTYSEATRRDVVRLLDVPEDKVTVAPMAVDDGFVAMDRDEASRIVKDRFGVAGPYLLFVSTLEPRKNVPTLLRAFHRLRDEIPHNLVLIGGVGWNAAPIFETIRALDLEDRVVRPGFVPHMELPAFYCAAAAFVFPTLYEGFGLPLLEALTCGCPVITSDNSSVPEVTGGAALTCDAMDEEGFAANVLRVLSDAGLREQLSVQGKAHAAHFSWDQCARTTMQVYRRLAACESY
jgi:glycosyltransferase involved in cell wall biosynthesis